MDMYGPPAPESFRIDDLLDLSNAEFVSASATTADSDAHHLPSSTDKVYSSGGSHYNILSTPNPNQYSSTHHYFTDVLCVPSDDVAELEWLSNFVDDSFNNFSATEFGGSANLRSATSSHGRSRTKRSKAASINNRWATDTTPMVGKPKGNATGKKRDGSSSSSGNIGRDRYSPSSSETSEAVLRRCTHCASEKTPQWRTGPLGPKTLCNACGVRYKSGRLVPEYRPAASPTFVLTQHSNSHRKVMELRRQKEGIRKQQQLQQEQHQLFLPRPHNFEVC